MLTIWQQKLNFSKWSFHFKYSACNLTLGINKPWHIVCISVYTFTYPRRLIKLRSSVSHLACHFTQRAAMAQITRLTLVQSDCSRIVHGVFNPVAPFSSPHVCYHHVYIYSAEAIRPGVQIYCSHSQRGVIYRSVHAGVRARRRAAKIRPAEQPLTLMKLLPMLTVCASAEYYVRPGCCSCQLISASAFSCCAKLWCASAANMVHTHHECTYVCTSLGRSLCSLLLGTGAWIVTIY